MERNPTVWRIFFFNWKTNVCVCVRECVRAWVCAHACVFVYFYIYVCVKKFKNQVIQN